MAEERAGTGGVAGPEVVGIGGVTVGSGSEVVGDLVGSEALTGWFS